MGTLAAKVGAEVTLRTSDAKGAVAGQKGHLHRRLDVHTGSINISGVWLGIADVTVKSAAADRVVLVVNAEKSILTINGKKVEAFVAGAQLKLDLAP
jgi:hypothetical protein